MAKEQGSGSGNDGEEACALQALVAKLRGRTFACKNPDHEFLLCVPILSENIVVDNSKQCSVLWLARQFVRNKRCLHFDNLCVRHCLTTHTVDAVRNKCLTHNAIQRPIRRATPHAAYDDSRHMGRTSHQRSCSAHVRHLSLHTRKTSYPLTK